MSTLIYHSGALGDFIAAFPLFSSLSKSRFDPVTLIGNQCNIALASAAGYISKGIDCNSASISILFSDTPDATGVSSFIRQYSLIILFCNPDSPLAQNIGQCAAGKVLIHPPFPGNQKPAIQYHLELLTQTDPPLPLPDCDVPILRLPQSAHKPFTLMSKPHSLIIHPGSGSRIKNWPFKNFSAVAETLRQRGVPIVWLTGPAEPQHPIPANDIHYCSITIPECCHLLQSGTVFLGNDSGITHLAAAVGTPSVVLFGPSDPIVWAPKGKNRVAILHHRFPCAPCHPEISIQQNCSSECLATITIDEVITAVEKLLPTNIS